MNVSTEPKNLLGILFPRIKPVCGSIPARSWPVGVAEGCQARQF